ncbi:HTTM domain-containing protein [Natronorubrum daqingense]|uniref:Vitamin K-dependent gamma-carboxylase n=1 Tax=Natronorubrum daqingense TaxID=588898 RepID=A0A1N7F7L1_9EURY|nr:HTTM domain-containing protein [Natronorubrum daqingense]APX97589.1 hypothetical protein BB347_13770 [Natronorubrum daqingense]SIR96309.1 Vitamin K-dependent gamma-carboxylase [Natronorubrum daqingense]
MSPASRDALSQSGRRLRTYLRRRIRIDTRSLAVFRIFVGVLIVADLLARSRNFSRFYTDDGVVPQALAQELSADGAFSFYHLTSDPTVIAGLFVLQGLIALQLIVGYKTRIATILSFLFVISLDHHNPFVLSYADTLFRLLLFWAIFLPLGERWSVDAVHADRERRAHVANAATVLILAQMVYMYLTNGLIKSQSEVWTSGDAAPLVLGIDEMTFFLGNTIRQGPILLELGGRVWFTILLLSWLLIVLPARARYPLVALFAIGHLSFALTVRIGAFPYVPLAGLVLFLQGAFWTDLNRLGGYVNVDSSRVAGSVTRLSALAATVPDYRLTSERIRRARRLTYSLALGIVVVSLLFVAVVMAFNVGTAIADTEADQSMDERVEGTVDETLYETAGVKQIESTASRFGVDQPVGWAVFAGPDPRTTDRYYVFPAETESGEVVDAYNERELTYDRPYDGELQNQYGSYRERFYMNSVRNGGNQNDVPVEFGEEICERWSEEHDEELVRISMYVVEEEITHDTITEPGDREQEFDEFHRHGCGDNEPAEVDSPM